MMNKEDKIKYYQAKYPKGSKLILTQDLPDPYTPKLKGDVFTSKGVVDSELQLLGSWRSGGSISLRLEDDHYKLLED
jgi:hypothetical protein